MTAHSIRSAPGSRTTRSSRFAPTDLARSGSSASDKLRWNGTRCPASTEHAIRHLAERVAGHSGQSVNEEHPLLSAALPTGERFQGVMPPATTAGGAFAIRKQVIKEMRLDDYRKLGSFEKVTTAGEGTLSETDRCLCEHLDAGRIEDVHPPRRGQPLFDPPVGRHELRQDHVPQRHPQGSAGRGAHHHHRGYARGQPDPEKLPAARRVQGRPGEARVTVETLLQASMRLRPDRIFLGEIRGAEAYSFLARYQHGPSGQHHDGARRQSRGRLRATRA